MTYNNIILEKGGGIAKIIFQPPQQIGTTTLLDALTASEHGFSILTPVDMGNPAFWSKGGCDEMPKVPV